MATAKAVKGAKRTAKPDSPFGSPSRDEVFDLLIPEGAESGQIPASDQYIGKLIALTKEDAKSTGNPMWVAVFTIVNGDFKGMDFKLFLPLSANALWKLADTLTALGVEWTPGKPFKFKLSDVLGTLVRLVIVDDKREGRDISKLQGVLPHPDGAGKKGKKTGFIIPKKAADEDDDEDADDGEDEDEEETPVQRVRKGKKRAKPVEEEEEDEEDEDEGEDEEEDEDEDDEEEGFPEPPPPPKHKKRSKAAVEEEDEDEGEDEGDEEDDEDEDYARPKPRKRSSVVERPVKKAKKRRAGRL